MQYIFNSIQHLLEEITPTAVWYDLNIDTFHFQATRSKVFEACSQRTRLIWPGRRISSSNKSTFIQHSWNRLFANLPRWHHAVAKSNATELRFDYIRKPIILPLHVLVMSRSVLMVFIDKIDISYFIGTLFRLLHISWRLDRMAKLLRPNSLDKNIDERMSLHFDKYLNDVCSKRSKRL